MNYRVILRPSAQRFLRQLRDKSLLTRLYQALRKLSENPRAAGCEKLTGPDDFLRIRVGDYRIIYQIRDEVLVILVVKIGHRREVYR